MSCTHTRTEPDFWYEDPDWEIAEWRAGSVVSTTKDLDTGRYQCTQCGEVMYYTALWKAHWEGGRKLLNERTGIVKSPRNAGVQAGSPAADPQRNERPRTVRKHEHPNGNGQCIHCGLYPTMLDCIERPEN